MLDAERKKLLDELISAVQSALESTELTHEEANKFNAIINKVVTKPAVMPESASQLKHGLFSTRQEAPTPSIAAKANVSREVIQLLNELKNDQNRQSRKTTAMDRAQANYFMGITLCKLAIETEDESYNERALNAYNTALELDPESFESLEERSTLHATMAKNDLAREDYESAQRHYDLAQEGLNFLKMQPKPKNALNALRRNFCINELEKLLSERNVKQAISLR